MVNTGTSVYRKHAATKIFNKESEPIKRRTGVLL
jgi:hypothetical protein